MVDWRARWIWMKGDPQPKNFYMYARGTFLSKKNLKKVTIHISADSRYKLYFNGDYIGRGPVRSDPRWQYFDSYDVTEKLRHGKNVVAVLVHHYGIPTSMYILGRGGLLCQVEAEDGDNIEVLLKTDTDWMVRRAEAYQQDVPRMRTPQGFIEVFDARKEPVGWNEIDFEDPGWDSPVIVGEHGPDTPHWIYQDPTLLPGARIQPWESLVARDIPFLLEEEILPKSIVDVGEVIQMHRSQYLNFDPAVHIASDTPFPLKNARVQGVENLLQKGGRPVIIENFVQDQPGYMYIYPGRRVNIPNAYIVLDFGKQVNGYLRFTLEGVEGGIVDIGYSEMLLNGRVYPLFRGNNGDRYIMRDGLQTWETFMWRSFRYVQLTFRNLMKPVNLHSVVLRFTSYPVGERSSFECSDETLSKIWKIAAYTCQLCMVDGYMDNPSDEQRHYSQTGRILCLVNYATFGDMKLAKKLWRQIAQSRMSNGCTKVAWPEGFWAQRLDLNFIDGPQMFILGIWEHYLYSGDYEFLKEIYPVALEQMKWFEKFLDDNGMINKLPCDVWIDHAGLDRRGEVAIVNAWYYLGLKYMIEIAETLKDKEAADGFRKTASKLKANFDRQFWDEKRGVYVDCNLDDVKSERVSEQTNCVLFLYGIADSEKLDKVLKYLYEERHETVMSTPLFMLYVTDAWCRVGKTELALSLLSERFGRRVKEGASTFGTLWTEEPQVHCQSEASGPAYVLSTHVLGVEPLKPGFDEFSVMPKPGNLLWAKGVFPSVKGDIPVSWSRSQPGFRIEVTVPLETIGEIGVPKLGLKKETIECNGETVWKAGKIVAKKPSIEEVTTTDEYVVFRVKTGKYVFEEK